VSIIRDPKVYLVGRQVVDDEALAAFLADHNVKRWSMITEVAGEALIDASPDDSANMSFAKPRPGGNAAYLGTSSRVGARFGP